MAYSVALPADLKKTSDSILTLVVPAPNGCNLSCPFCFIRQRKEAAERTDLAKEDYVRFISEMVSRERVAAICIQGYEPLLPEAFGYTVAILEAAQRHQIASSLITNGTFLADRISELETLNPYKIFVSLDADSAEAHDRQRGKAGAFDATIKGLRSVSSCSSALHGVVTVVSVLVPKKRDQLMCIPPLLRSLGVGQWIVNPLVRVGKDAPGGPKADRTQIFQDALMLKREADRYGIEFVVDDEFDRLSQLDETTDAVDINHRRFLSIQRLQRPGGVYRLIPNGQCSVGYELLQEVRSDTPRWIPSKMGAGDFIQSLRDAVPVHA